MIAGLYLCIPLIKIFVINASKKAVKYILTVLFIFTSVIPSFESIMPYKFGIYIPINSVYVFYLLLGYYIHYNKITINIGILWMLLMGYVFFTVLMPLNKDFVNLSGGGHIKLSGYNSPAVIKAGRFAVFCILRQKDKPGKIMEKAAPMCFGIYLIQTLFINILYKFIKFTPEKYPLVIITVMTALITIILSMSFSYAAGRIKIIKKYVL
jgi:surface polysaccharide O-acyltransferase-like enzyme